MSENQELPILQVLGLYCQSAYDKNLELYLSLYAEDAKIFETWGPEWLHHTPESWSAHTEEWFTSLKKDLMMIEFEEIQVEQTFQMGFISAFVKYVVTNASGEALRSQESRFTCIIEPRDGQWKITHQHSSGPIDRSNQKGILVR